MPLIKHYFSENPDENRHKQTPCNLSQHESALFRNDVVAGTSVNCTGQWRNWDS
jgi:hypothetical protein